MKFTNFVILMALAASPSSASLRGARQLHRYQQQATKDGAMAMEQIRDQTQDCSGDPEACDGLGNQFGDCDGTGDCNPDQLQAQDGTGNKYGGNRRTLKRGQNGPQDGTRKGTMAMEQIRDQTGDCDPENCDGNGNCDPENCDQEHLQPQDGTGNMHGGNRRTLKRGQNGPRDGTRKGTMAMEQIRDQTGDCNGNPEGCDGEGHMYGNGGDCEGNPEDCDGEGHMYGKQDDDNN